MITFLTCAILITAGVVQGSYIHDHIANGWVQEHRVIATWDEAFRRCNSEGAVLMSPITDGVLSAMMFRTRKDISYFIGANARFRPGLFVSVEGVPLEDMPVVTMLGLLNRDDGECLSINRQSISITPCSASLPFMCYKERNDGFNITECGTIDKAYKLSNSTGSCYKFHSRITSWTEAYSTCILEGGYLAIINDNNEAKEIVNFMNRHEYYVHLGLADWNGKGDWMSIFGDSIRDIYHAWKDDIQPAEPCCQIGTIEPRKGLLAAYNDNVRTYFICEKDPKSIRFPYSELDQKMDKILFD